jgi:hypothetical protein
MIFRDKVKSMFYHAYNGYLEHAYPLDELKPLTCKGNTRFEILLHHCFKVRTLGAASV